jgi:hypothetical protein
MEAPNPRNKPGIPDLSRGSGPFPCLWGRSCKIRAVRIRVGVVPETLELYRAVAQWRRRTQETNQESQTCPGVPGPFLVCGGDLARYVPFVFASGLFQRLLNSIGLWLNGGAVPKKQTRNPRPVPGSRTLSLFVGEILQDTCRSYSCCMSRDFKLVCSARRAEVRARHVMVHLWATLLIDVLVLSVPRPNTFSMLCRCTFVRF